MAEMTKMEMCPRCEGAGVVVALALAGGLARTKLCPVCQGAKRVDVKKQVGHFAGQALQK